MVKGPNETGFAVCRMPDGTLTHGPVSVGTPMAVNIDVRCPPGSKLEALFHTHPDDPRAGHKGVPIPSPVDVDSTRRSGAPFACIDASGRLECFRIR